MKQIKVLDCTLRDGGYCNNWKFDQSQIDTVISNLIDAGLDIIECGYLSNTVNKSEGTIYFSIYDVDKLVRKYKTNKAVKFSLMINHGEYDLSVLPSKKESEVDVIRYAFHKNEISEALDNCNILMQKGYEVYCQPMVTNAYTDDELQKLVGGINLLNPTYVYIVDSFGSLTIEELNLIFDRLDMHLNKNIGIGFHAHNNLQLAFSNSINFIDKNTDRQIIVDVTVMGIGRGAGNLNSELLMDWMNRNLKTKFNLEKVLIVADKVINAISEKRSWGYSLANYLSAIHNCHPNYSNYLVKKKTLLYEDMNNVFRLMSEEQKKIYDEYYIEMLYTGYLSEKKSPIGCNINSNIILEDEVLVIGSGMSACVEKEKIFDVLTNNKNLTSISLNFDYSEIKTDYIFLSNIRRYEQMERHSLSRTIVTSNISTNICLGSINYKDYLTNIEYVRDNALVLLINYLVYCNVKKVYLAGIDGYSSADSNYINEGLEIFLPNDVRVKIDNGLRQFIKQKQEEIDIEIITGKLFN